MSSSSIETSRSKMALIILLLAASPAVLGNVVQSDERDFAKLEPRVLRTLLSKATAPHVSSRTGQITTFGERRASGLQRAANTFSSLVGTVNTVRGAVGALRGGARAQPFGASAAIGAPLPPLGQVDPTLGAVDANGFPLDSVDPNTGLPFAGTAAPLLPAASAPLPPVAPAPLLARSYEYELYAREPEPEPLFHELLGAVAEKAPAVIDKAKAKLQSFASHTTNTAAVALVGGAGVAAAGPLAAGSINPATGLPIDPATGAPINPVDGSLLTPPASDPTLAPLAARSLERREPAPEPIFGTEKLAAKAAAFVLAKAPGLATKAKGLLKSVFKKKTSATTTTGFAGGAGVAAALASAPLAPPLAPPPLAAPAAFGAPAALSVDPTAPFIDPVTGQTIDPLTGQAIDPVTGLPITTATAALAAPLAAPPLAAPLAARSVERKAEVDKRCVVRRGTAGARAYARCLESLNDLD